MTEAEIGRLIVLDKRIREIADAEGLHTTDIIFEVVPAQRVLEGMSYDFPVNFSHWSFGRDYDRHRTIYEHTGGGIPYEQVWNVEPPRAFLVETNPFALNALIVAHVYGHVDFFLENSYLQRGREFSNTAEEAAAAADRFLEYEAKHGKERVEAVIDAAMAIRWHANPNPFFEEQDEETVRERLLAWERAKLERGRDTAGEFAKSPTEDEARKAERRLEWMRRRTPPEPTYDLLHYISRNSPRPLDPWMMDILTVIRNQSRMLALGARTKLLNEGWATYWHVRVMRQLFEEGLLTPEEHETFNYYHSGVTRKSRKGFNWYRIGPALLEYIEERWNKGQFGREYDDCEDPHKRDRWDTGAGLGRKKIFEVRSAYTDRMAVEEFFTDEFIREQELFLYEEEKLPDGTIADVISERDPQVVRQVLKASFSQGLAPQVTVENGNFNENRELLLRHRPSGFELEPIYRDGALRKIQFLWGRRVHLFTRYKREEWVFSCADGKVKGEKAK